MKSFAALALIASASAQSSMVWHQSEEYAVYTSSGLSRHAGTTPTFATSTWLNAPIFVEVFNVSDSGENIWSYASTSTGLPTFQVDMARHADSYGVGAIDTIAAEAQFVPPSSCQVFAWSSLGGNGTPAWSVNVPNCDSSLLYDDDVFVVISDDGSTAAFSGYVSTGAQTLGTLWVFAAQTGTLLFQKTLSDPSTAPGGPVQISENGTWVAWNTGDGVQIVDGKTGAVRGTINNGGTMAEISDSGDYVAFAAGSTAYIYTWDAPNSQYKLAFSPTPPNGTWYATSVAISSDGSGAKETELVTVGYIDDSALQALVIIFSMVDASILTTYLSPMNSQLQTYPTVTMSGNYAGVSLWGDNADVPTAIVLSAVKPDPVFTFVTPGSMFGLAILHDLTASTPTTDTVYFTVSGKHVPANVMGNGGDAYAWVIKVAK